MLEAGGKSITIPSFHVSKCPNLCDYGYRCQILMVRSLLEAGNIDRLSPIDMRREGWGGVCTILLLSGSV
jgi:hypothetical protein